MNLEFFASSSVVDPGIIRQASHCTVCNRMVDLVAVTEDGEFAPLLTIKCHGETWSQRHPMSDLSSKTFRIVVPPETKLLT